ncbi:uncharacterized protein [Haliotis cracherodii]|uniref:uncharacterized protein n=1 Tax=Haliotis cracherodii TaxID=6455 RepID=UPI0039E85BB2
MILSLLVFTVVVLKVNSMTLDPGTKKFSYGVEAERLCKAYKKVCPLSKICVIQHLVWPRKMSFPVCVHEQKIEVKSKVCELAPAPGVCGARFRRWYFNVHAGKCSWFTYGGCDGNMNNFRNEEECKRVCLHANASSESLVTSNAIVSIPADPALRKPAVLPHPAPIPLQMKASDAREAFELDTETDEQKLEKKMKRREYKLRRKHRKGRKGRKGKRRRGRKHNITGPYAELRVRKTSYRSEKAQNDQGEDKLAKRNRERKIRKYRKSKPSFYRNFRLFRILASKDNPIGISLR